MRRFEVAGRSTEREALAVGWRGCASGGDGGEEVQRDAENSKGER